jgi:hypothetical protein
MKHDPRVFMPMTIDAFTSFSIIIATAGAMA